MWMTKEMQREQWQIHIDGALRDADKAGELGDERERTSLLALAQLFRVWQHEQRDQRKRCDCDICLRLAQRNERVRGLGLNGLDSNTVPYRRRDEG